MPTACPEWFRGGTSIFKLRVCVALSLLAALGFGCAHTAPPRSGSNPAKAADYVILLHGLDCTALSLSGMEFALAKEGYAVINEAYPSSRLSVQDAADQWLARLLAARATNSTVKIHFVTHSMGGLVVRQYLHDHSLTNLGRVVMMAPPNHGSILVDKYKGNVLYKLFAGPAGQELGTGAADLPEQLGPVNFELGVIAGDRSQHPIWSSWIAGPDDGKVAVESTKVEGMKDFLVVHHTHTWMMWKKDVIEAVAQFLATGHFAPADGRLAELEWSSSIRSKF